MEQLTLDLEPQATWVIDMWVPEGFKRCSGYSPTNRPPHAIPATADYFYELAKGGLSSMCRECNASYNDYNKRLAIATRNSGKSFGPPTEWLRCSGEKGQTHPHPQQRQFFGPDHSRRTGVESRCEYCASLRRKSAVYKETNKKTTARRDAAPRERYHFASIIVEYGFACHLCTQPFNPDYDLKDIVKEHIVPLKRGGHDVASNAAPAHPRCNAFKGVHTMEELEEYGTLDWMRGPNYDPYEGFE